MLAKEISSLQHPIVKYLTKLRTSKELRYEKQHVLIAGKKQVLEAQALELLLVQKDFSFPPLPCQQRYLVSAEILKKITGLSAPEPVAGVVPMPLWDNLQGKKWVVALCSIRDPGNLGTLLRTALALGWEGAFLTEDCADPYNEKALRAAKGATFHLPLRLGTAEELIAYAEKENQTVWVADMEGTPLSQVKPHPPTMIILGNEAQGVSASLKERFKKISIPIREIQSLNVAAAGAILLYTLKT